MIFLITVSSHDAFDENSGEVHRKWAGEVRFPVLSDAGEGKGDRGGEITVVVVSVGMCLDETLDGANDAIDVGANDVVSSGVGNSVPSTAILGKSSSSMLSSVRLGTTSESWACTVFMWWSLFDFFKKGLLQIPQILFSQAAFLLLFTL